jgi:hypothetical protein
MQTVGEATSSVTNVFKSTFSSLASSLQLPKLRDSFYQNIIYIIIVIIILIGILVYIQMVGTTHINPLNLPPSKEVKNIQIQKVVEGFDMEQNGGIEEFAGNINTVGASGNLYESTYDGVYDGAFGEQYDTADLTTDLFHNDEPNSSRKRR